MDNIALELSVSIPNKAATKGKQKSQRLKPHGNMSKASSMFEHQVCCQRWTLNNWLKTAFKVVNITHSPSL